MMLNSSSGFLLSQPHGETAHTIQGTVLPSCDVCRLSVSNTFFFLDIFNLRLLEHNPFYIKDHLYFGYLPDGH